MAKLKLEIKVNTTTEEILQEFLDWYDDSDESIEESFDDWWYSENARFIDFTLIEDDSEMKVGSAGEVLQDHITCNHTNAVITDKFEDYHRNETIYTYECSCGHTWRF